MVFMNTLLPLKKTVYVGPNSFAGGHHSTIQDIFWRLIIKAVKSKNQANKASQKYFLIPSYAGKESEGGEADSQKGEENEVEEQRERDCEQVPGICMPWLKGSQYFTC